MLSERKSRATVTRRHALKAILGAAVAVTAAHASTPQPELVIERSAGLSRAFAIQSKDGRTMLCLPATFTKAQEREAVRAYRAGEFCFSGGLGKGGQ